MKNEKNVFRAGWAAVAFILLLTLQVTAGGIAIAVPNAAYSRGGQISVTFTCTCPFPCGNAMGMDDIYLRRLAWDRNHQMGLWYALGNLRDGGAAPTSATRTFTIPADVPAANDYVISVWSGEESCSGDSNTFAVREHGPATAACVFTSPRFGSTVYNGSPLWLLWSGNDGWGDGVQLTLRCGDRVARSFGTVTAHTALWEVGTRGLHHAEDDYSTCPPDARYYFRIQKLHSEEYCDSGMFTIANPTLQLDGPGGGETFYRGGRLQVRWTASHLPAGEKVRVVLKFEHVAASCFKTRPIHQQMELTAQGSGGSFDWTIPTSGNLAFPLLGCDPLSCQVEISLANYPEVFDRSLPLTIDHRRR